MRRAENYPGLRQGSRRQGRLGDRSRPRKNAAIRDAGNRPDEGADEMNTSGCRRCRPATWILILSMALVCTSRAQEDAALPSPSQESPQSPAEGVQPAELKLLTNYVEGGGNYLALTNGFGNWTGGYAGGGIAQGKTIWNV